MDINEVVTISSREIISRYRRNTFSVLDVPLHLFHFVRSPKEMSAALYCVKNNMRCSHTTKNTVAMKRNELLNQLVIGPIAPANRDPTHMVIDKSPVVYADTPTFMLDMNMVEVDHPSYIDDLMSKELRLAEMETTWDENRTQPAHLLSRFIVPAQSSPRLC